MSTRRSERVPAGVPAGGQFASQAHAESQVSLDAQADADAERAALARERHRLATNPVASDRTRLPAARSAVRQVLYSEQELSGQPGQDPIGKERVAAALGDDTSVLDAVARVGTLPPAEQESYGDRLAAALYDTQRDGEATIHHQRRTIPTTAARNRRLHARLLDETTPAQDRRAEAHEAVHGLLSTPGGLADVGPDSDHTRDLIDSATCDPDKLDTAVDRLCRAGPEADDHTAAHLAGTLYDLAHVEDTKREDRARIWAECTADYDTPSR